MEIAEMAERYHIILASASPRRKELLKQIGISFQVLVSSVKEALTEAEPGKAAAELARQKAEDVEKQYLEQKPFFPERDYLILAADTVVSVNGEILGKPKDAQDAVRMLHLLQGKQHQVYTGVALVTAKKRRVFFECTNVEIAPMTGAQIAEYVETGEPLDKAGAYGIQGRFAAYVQRIEGDFYNVVGLPLARLVQEISALEDGRTVCQHAFTDKEGQDALSDKEGQNALSDQEEPARGVRHGAAQVRFVATDIDGTLVKESSPEVDPEIFRVFRELISRGVICCVASGRQYYGIREMFSEIADDIVYIAENGAHIVYQGRNLSVTNMRREQAHEIIRQMRSYGKGYEFVVSTPQGSLLESRDESFIRLIRDGYRNRMEIVKDVLEKDPVIIKCAMHHDGSVRDVAEGELIPAWKDSVKVCMAGEDWIDFMDGAVDKGNAIRFLQDYFGVGYDETMVFGDNENDIGMMKAAGMSYAVENACEAVKRAAKHICPDYTKKGVCQILRGLLGKK